MGDTSDNVYRCGKHGRIALSVDERKEQGGDPPFKCPQGGCELTLQSTKPKRLSRKEWKGTVGGPL